MKSISQSPTDPAFVQDPYPFYDRARALGDIVWWDEYEMPVAFSHRAANEMLRDRRLGRECPPERRPEPQPHLAAFDAIEAHSMLELDPPAHTRLRRSVGTAFNTARVQAMAPTVSQFVDRFISELPEGRFDIIGQFASLLPVHVIARLLGLPEGVAPRLLDWSHAMVAMYQARRDRAVEDDANRAAAEFSDFIRESLAERRRATGDDLLSALAEQQAEGELSEDEVVSTVILLLNAGHEATVHSFGNGILLYLDGTLPASALKPVAIASTVDEILRYEPPLHLFRRYAGEDINILGYRLARHDAVGICLAAANRDPAVWAAPEQFDPTRPAPNHLSFGAGIHFCLGAALARLELQVGLPVLASRLPGLRVVEPPKFANLYHFRGLERLMVSKG